MADALNLFSPHLPKLQIAWDATSYRALQFCPRYYQYSILEGYRGGSVDLEFGILAHKGREIYLKARHAGVDHAQAQLDALWHVLEASWTDDGPWRGTYEAQWRCKGEKPYKNPKGNRAKCPYSHKGKWFSGSAPGQCGVCSSAVESDVRFLPWDKYKNRPNLLRLVYAYTEEANTSPWKTLTLDDGKPAIEMSFKLQLPLESGTGERFWAVGYMDEVKHLSIEEGSYVTDFKTTTKTLNDRYFATFNPGVQVEWYDMVGSFIMPNANVRGVLIEGAQLLVGGVQFNLGQMPVNMDVRLENLGELSYWLQQAEDFATKEYWPKNRANCAICGFKEICKASPSKRPAMLEANFERNYWDPTKERT